MTETEREIEDKCCESVFSLGGDHIRKEKIKFKEIILGNRGEHGVKETERLLIIIQSAAEFWTYVRLYDDAYKKETGGRSPNKIVFKQCHIVITENGVYPEKAHELDLIECKLELSENLIDKLRICKIRNSDIEIKHTQMKLKYISEISETVFSTNILLNPNDGCLICEN